MLLTHEQRKQKIAELRLKLLGEQDTAYFLQKQLEIKTLDGIARAHYEAEQRKNTEKLLKIKMEMERLRQ
jgi:hypothetical protein